MSRMEVCIVLREGVGYREPQILPGLIPGLATHQLCALE